MAWLRRLTALELVETLERIEQKFARQLEKFQGETSPFLAATEDLARCLESHYREKESLRPKPYMLVFAFLFVFLLGGWFTFSAWRNHRWRGYVETLGRQPGVVITSSGRERGHFVIRGLRDPLSADPQTLLRTAGLDPRQAEFHWGAYYALDDPILQQRAITILKPPSGVTLTVADGILRAQGAASDDWFANFPSRASAIPGIRGTDASQLVGASEAEFQRLAGVIQSTVLKFPGGQRGPSSRAIRFSESFWLLKSTRFLQKAQALHKSIAVEVIGHSDSTGPESTNQLLSRNRADTVASQLARDGAPRNSLRPTGVASAQPLRPETDEQARQSNRSVTLRISATASPKS